MTKSNPENIRILIPFLKAGIKVLNELSNVSFNKKGVYPFQGNKSIGDVKIEIPVLGDIQSRVVFDMSREFAFHFAKLMVGNIATEEDVELMESAILELGNIISGNAMKFLEEININCSIRPPQVYIGKNIQLFNAQTHIGVIEFVSEIGNFNIYLVIKEEKPLLESTGILLFNITEIISNFIVESFIPKGFSVYSTSDLDMAMKILEKQEIVLAFVNQIQSYNINLADQVRKMLEKKTNLRIVFYSRSNEWDPKLIKKFPNWVLGYIPCSFDAVKTAKALILILDKIGIKYNQKRKHVRIQLGSEDKSMAILYKDIRGEGDIINAQIRDISLGGALLELSMKEAEKFKLQQIIPRCQLKLKGYIIRTTAQVIRKNDNQIGISFRQILDEDVKKIAHFIHDKLQELMKQSSAAVS